jgi:uncharacterized membrane protein YciS (DUF1049 family)
MVKSQPVSVSFLDPSRKTVEMNSIAPERSRIGPMLLAAIAAFSAYFCMYAFRKPFSAATYEGLELWGFALKGLLVTSQLFGYMLSKFIGIKVISEMPARYRAISILGLIGFAELALVGFAYGPMWSKPLMLFANGLPLGMIFGLVLGFLEGRQQTEALSAALCASFIISSGVVKSVGRALIENWGVSDFAMPMLTGLIFVPPLLISVALLQMTPPPSANDIARRKNRPTLSAADRREFVLTYWPGLLMLIGVFVLLTIIRSARDDFSVEFWKAMAGDTPPSTYALTETIVGFVVTALVAGTMFIRKNVNAMAITMGLMCVAFAVAGASVIAQRTNAIGPFSFMVACGIGLYVPYVAIHTTLFERLIAAAQRPSNLAFLMYLADSLGYLGYQIALLGLPSGENNEERLLTLFRNSLLGFSIISIVALLFAILYFYRKLGTQDKTMSESPLVLPTASVSR